MARLRQILKGREWRRFQRNRTAMVCATFILLLILVAVFANFLTPSNPDSQNLMFRNAAPSARFWLGADMFGRDLLSRLIMATRVTLVAASIGLAVAVGLGIPLGLLTGFLGGFVDAVLSRLADALLSLPALILALAIVGVAGPGLINAMIAVGFVLSPRLFRVARGAAIAVAHESYIEAARADGCSVLRLLFRHVVPNASGPLLVQTSFALGFIISAEASWGSVLRDAFGQVDRSPFQIAPPSILIALTVFAFSVLGDALRDSRAREF